MQMTEPKLRFKADDGSQFPDWEEKKLGDITSQYKVRNKKRLPLEIYSVNNIVGFIPQSEQFDDAGYLKDTDTSIYMIVPPRHFAYNPARLDIGSIGYQYLDHDVQVSSLYEVFETSDLVNDEFLWSWFHTHYFNNVVKRLQEGGVRLYFYYDKMQEVKIGLPSLPEQQKIAEFLSTIDTVIEKQKETVSAWEERKQGVMQKLFSQEVRFKADDGSEFPEWEKKPFGDIVSEFKVKTKVENEDTLLSCAINGVFLNSELFGHQRGQSNIGYLKIKKGTLILSAQNLHLGNANVNLRFEHGIISPAYKTYDIVGCSAEYMSQWVKWDMTKQFFYNATTVGASECRRNVDWNMLYSQLFAVPCLAEQRKIADCLSSLDEVIEKQKATLAAWEELKKGLLQQMFV